VENLAQGALRKNEGKHPHEGLKHPIDRKTVFQHRLSREEFLHWTAPGGIGGKKKKRGGDY